MKKILVISRIISGSSLAKRLAQQNLEIQVDYIGPKTDGLNPDNLNHLGETYDQSLAYSWLQQIYKDYDYICACDHLFQKNQEFHKWKSSINVPILAPDIGCYQLEYSKIYTKSICEKLGIPVPRYKIFYEDDLKNFYDFYNNSDRCVFKLDQTNISFGWQTRIIEQGDDIKSILKHYKGWINNMFVEEYIRGQDISFHVLSNGDDCIYLGSAKDYKRLYDGDCGMNCGSAGGYSPVENFDLDLQNTVLDYSKKIVNYLKNQGIKYRGILYLGIRISEIDKTPYLLEINTRSGNPELNVILPSIESNNLLKNLISAATGDKLEPTQFNNTTSMAVTILNKNYSPNMKFEELPILEKNKNLEYYFYDSSEFLNNYYSCIIATSTQKESCKNILDDYLNNIDLKNFRYRFDIGS